MDFLVALSSLSCSVCLRVCVCVKERIAFAECVRAAAAAADVRRFRTRSIISVHTQRDGTGRDEEKKRRSASSWPQPPPPPPPPPKVFCSDEMRCDDR